MLIKTLLKKCETGFDLVIVADSTSGHTLEFTSVKDALEVSGSEKVITWEVGRCKEIDRGSVIHKWILFITI